jgi:hypothetical protein
MFSYRVMVAMLLAASCAFAANPGVITELPLTVYESAGLDGLRPVTGGVPLPEGAAPQGAAFSLKDSAGTEVPLQTSVLARWKDGSARWVLLDFQSSPPQNGSESYTLDWTPDSAEIPGATSAPSAPTIAPAENGLLRIADRVDVVLSLTDGEGQLCNAVIEEVDAASNEELRSIYAVRGAFHDPAGKRLFQFRLCASTYAGLSLVRLEPVILIDASEGVMQHIRDLRLTLRPRDTPKQGRLGGEPGWAGSVASPVRIFQRDDEQYAVEHLKDAANESTIGVKAPGWAEMQDDQGSVAVALRSFWQQWPKAMEVSTEGLSVGLLPKFQEGDFAHMEPWYKHQYLFEGDRYRLRTGQARRWEVWVDLSGDGVSLAKAANAPLVLSPDPAHAIASDVWGAISPAGTSDMVAYDAWADNLFEAYRQSITAQRDYGAMNWGDWFGERKVNWGNHEYDTTNQFLIQFARTGDPKYFYAADAAARHSSEVDTIHHVNDDLAKHFGVSTAYPARPGMVHQHTVGHVSGFYPDETIRTLFVERNIGNSPRPYLCLSPYNLGHIWTQGLTRHYFLTGDPFVRETVEKIGGNLAQLVEDREYRFMGHSHCGRVTGWTLLALSGAYEISLNPRYLDAMKTLVDDALAEQDPVCGGWLYSLPRGHCNCEKAKHVGMAGFITSVLVNGLSQYHTLTGDERIPDAVRRAVTFLDRDTWHEEWQDWRYTSCPATGPINQMGVVVMAHVNAIRMAEDPEQLRVLQAAWKAKFDRLSEVAPSGLGQGKTFSSTMYGCPEAAGLLAGRAQSSF